MRPITHLTLYGKHSSTYEYLKTLLKRQSARNNIQLDIQEVNETDIFIREGIMSIPAVRIGSVVKERDTQKIEDYAESIMTLILRNHKNDNMEKIVVPIDFSDASENAANYAALLANETNAALKIIHVYHPVPVTSIDGGYIDPQQEQIFREKFEKYVSDFKKKHDFLADGQITLEHDFIIGLAADQIAKFSNNEGNIVVIGSTGASATFKKIFGSVSVSVVKKADGPVLVIPPDVSFKSPKRILLCVDQELKETDKLKGVISLAKMFSADLHLFHVHQKGDKPINLSDLHELVSDEYDPSKVYSQELQSPDLLHTVFEYIIEKEMDIVSLNRHERGFFADLFHSSFTEKMARQTNLPLLVNHTT